MLKKGWFHTEGRPGDRALEGQMMGLDQLLAEVPGKTVLDVGCAEGLISLELAKAGAKSCHGVEIVPGHVAVAHKLTGTLPCTFEVMNLNERLPAGRFDIVLMLAILHKLMHPSDVAREIASRCDDPIVIRLPPTGPVVVDVRSGNEPHDIGAAMASEGFDLECVEPTIEGEWLGYFRRRAAAVAPKESDWQATIQEAADAAHARVAADAHARADQGSSQGPVAGEPPAASAHRPEGEQTVDKADDFIHEPEPKPDMSSPPDPAEPTATAKVEGGATLFPESPEPDVLTDAEKQANAAERGAEAGSAQATTDVKPLTSADFPNQ